MQSGTECTDLIQPSSFLSQVSVFRKQGNDSARCLVFTSRKVGLCSSFSSVLYSWGAVRRAEAVCK